MKEKAQKSKKQLVDSSQEIGLSQKTKTFAASCIDTLISSESKIHGIPEDSVHFHEASSIDTLVDIVGIAIALEDLNYLMKKLFVYLFQLVEVL